MLAWVSQQCCTGVCCKITTTAGADFLIGVAALALGVLIAVAIIYVIEKLS